MNALSPLTAFSLTGSSYSYQQRKMNSIMGTTGSNSSNNYLKRTVLLVVESGAVLVSSYVSLSTIRHSFSLNQYLQIIALVLEKLGNPAEHILLNALVPLYVSSSSLSSVEPRVISS